MKINFGSNSAQRADFLINHGQTLKAYVLRERYRLLTIGLSLLIALGSYFLVNLYLENDNLSHKLMNMSANYQQSQADLNALKTKLVQTQEADQTKIAELSNLNEGRVGAFAKQAALCNQIKAQLGFPTN